MTPDNRQRPPTIAYEANGKPTGFVAVAAVAIPVVVFALVLSLNACATTTTSSDQSEHSTRLAPPDDAGITPPEGFRLDREGSDLPPMISRLVSGESTTPILARTMIYVPESGSDLIGTTGSITLTVATYPGTVGALATYNGWFAEYGFPAAAERKSLDFGEAAERFDLEWPPLHAVIARDGARFALVIADGSLPAAIRTDAMEWLARAATGAHQTSD